MPAARTAKTVESVTEEAAKIAPAIAPAVAPTTAEKTVKTARAAVAKTAKTAQATAGKVVEKATEVNGKNPVTKVVRNVLLAAIGTVALGKEEIEAIVSRLVERGEIAEKDGREMITDLFERRPKELPKPEIKVEGVLDGRVEGILSRMNVPSRSDVEELGKKIADLSRKVDDLSKKLAA